MTTYNRLWLLAAVTLLVTGCAIMLGSIAGIREADAVSPVALTREYESDPLTVQPLSANTECFCPLFLL